MGKIQSVLKKYLKSVGLFYHDVEEYEIPYDADKYSLTKNSEKIKIHRDFLRSIFEQEESRMKAIENKTSQLVAQTGIIFSLLSLFVPILIDKGSYINIAVKSCLVTLLVVAFLFYGLTIINAAKNYRISKFRYAKPSPNNVLLLKDKTVSAFLAEEVRDLLKSVKVNENINNRKGTNLLHAYNAFRLANIVTGILVLLFSSNMFFLKSEQPHVLIKNPLEVKQLDSLVHIINKKTNIPDTIIIRSKDSCLNISR